MVIIALLTDFGTKDYFVGAMKGAILSINENVHLIDITHEIEPQDIKSASFNLRACYKNFMVGTIFVAVVDPGVGSERRAILVETDDYFFIAPDNGILSFIFNEGGNASANERAEVTELARSHALAFPPLGFRVFELTNNEYFAEKISATF